MFAPDPATARSSATTDASKAMLFVESRLYVGGRFEWYCGFDQIELDSPRASLGQIRTERRNRRRYPPLSEAHAGGGIADPQPGGPVVAAHDLDALVPGVAHDVGLVDPAVLGFGDKPGPQRMR